MKKFRFSTGTDPFPAILEVIEEYMVREWGEEEEIITKICEQYRIDEEQVRKYL